MMPRICTAIVCCAAMIAASKCSCAEFPRISVLIKSHEETTFGKLLPMIALLKEAELPISFAIQNEPGVCIIIRMTTDLKLVERAELEKLQQQEADVGEPQVLYIDRQGMDQWMAQLRRLGADKVVIESIPIMPIASFSIEAVEQLRRDQRPVILICHADWDVRSRFLNESLLYSKDMISAVAQSPAVIMLVDMTNRGSEEETQFLRQLRAVPLCFVHFAPGEPKPVVVSDTLNSEDTIRREFVRLLKPGE